MCDLDVSRVEINYEESSTETSDISTSSESEEEDETTESLKNFAKKEVRILLVGLTGHGKSSLINKIMGEDLAKVEHGFKACQHKKFIEEYEITFNSTILYLYDTQGMGDASVSGTEIFKTIKNKLNKVDLMIICHQLFSRAEEATGQMLHQVVSECGKDMLQKNSVLCYTHADYYKVAVNIPHGKSKEEKKSLREQRVQEQKDSLTKAIKDFLVTEEKILTEEEFHCIPICISSKTKKNLPTANNWYTKFMHCCAERSKEDGARFLTWFEKNRRYIKYGVAAGGAGVVAGAVAGAKIGAVSGSIVGVGAGAVVGATVGYITGMVGTKGKKSKRKTAATLKDKKD